MEKSSTVILCEKAKAASATLSGITDEKINRALLAMADKLVESSAEILSSNEEDLEAARGKISEVMLDRLRLTESRIEAMAKGIREIAELPSPLGRILEKKEAYLWGL